MTESVCLICRGPRDFLHASTWGVSGKLLGCNTYYLCPACTERGNHRVEKSSLSPCGEKHVQLKKDKNSVTLPHHGHK
jgi:hypothetical protein